MKSLPLPWLEVTTRSAPYGQKTEIGANTRRGKSQGITSQLRKGMLRCLFTFFSPFLRVTTGQL